MGTIDEPGRGRLPRPIEWVIGSAAVVGAAAGCFGSATMNVSRPLTIGVTSVAAVLLGFAGATAVLRRRGAADGHHGPGPRAVGGFGVVIALGLAALSVGSGVTGWTPHGLLREILTGPGQLASLPLATSPSLEAELYFGALSTIINTVHDAPDFSADYALARAQPDLCAAVVVVNDLAAGSGSISASFSGPRWTPLESVPDNDIGGLPFIRQPLLTPPGAEPAGARVVGHVTVREDTVVATGRYVAELLGSSGPHRLWVVDSTGADAMVECTQYQR